MESQTVHRREFISERIPRGLLRGKRANVNDVILKNRRFSAAYCGKLQFGNERTIGKVFPDCTDVTGTFVAFA